MDAIDVICINKNNDFPDNPQNNNESINDDNNIIDDNIYYGYSDNDSDIEDVSDISIHKDTTLASKMLKKSIVNDGNCIDDLTKAMSKTLKTILQSWAVVNKITLSALSKLLHEIRNNLPMLSLLLDPRTLLKTPIFRKVNIAILDCKHV